MPATQVMRGVLLGISAISLKPLTISGEEQSPPGETIWLSGVTEVQIETIVEQGERTVISVDGVGVIDVIEEDDTLVGIDLTITGINVGLEMLSTALGGTTQLMHGAITGWVAPTIAQQRAQARRFEVDLYVTSVGSSGQIDGYLRHRLHFCSGMIQGMSHSVKGVSRPALRVKARAHPTTREVHRMEFMDSVPSH